MTTIQLPDDTRLVDVIAAARSLGMRVRHNRQGLALEPIHHRNQETRRVITDADRARATGPVLDQ